MNTSSSLPNLPDLLITDSSADQEVITWFEMICDRARKLDRAELDEN